MKLVPLSPDMFREVAKLHKRLMPWSFMSQAGDKVIAQFYKGLVGSGSGFGIVAVENDTVAGFAIGVYDNRVLLRDLLMSNGFGLAVSLFMGVVDHPGIVGKFLAVLNEEGRSQGKILPSAKSLFIGVSPDVKKGMLFFRLLYELNSHFVEKRIETYAGRMLVSNPVRKVYQRLPGYTEIETVRVYGLDWINYKIEIRLGQDSLKQIAVQSGSA